MFLSGEVARLRRERDAILDVLEDDGLIDGVFRDYEGMSADWIMRHYRDAVRERVTKERK